MAKTAARAKSKSADTKTSQQRTHTGVRPPDIKKEAGWENLKLPFNIGSGRTLYTGLEQDGRLKMRFFKRTSDGHLVGKVWFGPGADGPPGHAHGGAIAYVLDEAMGSVAWMNHFPVVAAKLEFEYNAMTPLESLTEIHAWIETQKTKSLVIRAALMSSSGETYVTATGYFAILAEEKIAELLKKIKLKVDLKKLKWAKHRAD